MDQRSIGKTLRMLREQNGYSVLEATEKLKEQGIYISDKALYSYETGTRGITADVFLSFCIIYGCSDILETFTGVRPGQPDYTINNSREKTMLEHYRDLEPDHKDLIDTMVDKMRNQERGRH